MSQLTDRYDIDKLPNQSLAVTQCGIQICDAGHSSGSLLYEHYSAHFILEGKGVYMVNGKTYELSAGQGFMITPGCVSMYNADIKEPWKYIYATFMGTDDDSLVHNAGLDDENVTFNFPLDDEMIHDLYAMHNASKKYDALGYDVVGWFLLVMSRLIAANTATSKELCQPEHYINKAVLYIENNYPHSITVKDIADFVGIDRTYLYKLFKKSKNQSPTEFLGEYRLIKSVEMMENYDISIGEIALSTGFYDVSHYYRAFSAKYGKPPKVFRNQLYGKED